MPEAARKTTIPAPHAWWYVPVILLTLFGSSLQLSVLLILSPIDLRASDIDYILGMKGDFGSLHFDYSNYSSLLSSPTKGTTNLAKAHLPYYVQEKQ